MQIETHIIRIEPFTFQIQINLSSDPAAKPVEDSPALSSYLRELGKFKSAKTKELYELAAMHIEKFSPRKLHEIDVPYLEAFKAHLLASVKHNSAQTYFARVTTAMNTAFCDGLILRNPAAKVKKIQIERKERDFLTESEIEQLAAVQEWRNENPFFRISFFFLCATGLRFSDMRRVTFAQIRDNTLIFRAKKTSKSKRLPLNDAALHCIALSRALQPDAPPDALVFHVPALDQYNEVLKLWAHKAGIEKSLSSHIGRHSFATNLVLKNTPLPVVQRLLDHSKLETTAIYTHITDALKSETVNVLHFPAHLSPQDSV